MTTTRTARASRTTRTALPLLGAAGLLLAGLGAAPAEAADSASAAAVCQLRILSITANDLDDDPRPTDEISLRLGTTPTVERTYTQGQKRNVLGDGTKFFSGPLVVRLVERDGAVNEVLAQRTVPCRTQQVESVLVGPGNDAAYTILWRVDRI